MNETTVPKPRHGSAESYEQMMRRAATDGSNLFPFTIGVIEGIVSDLYISDAQKLKHVRNALVARHLVSSEPDLDPTGLAYTRADDGDQPQPVAGRVPAHLEDGVTGAVIAVADGHRVHECCGKLGDAPHRTFCARYVPVADRYKPSLIIGDTADEQRDNAYAAYQRDEVECPSSWHVNQGDKRSRCPICNQAD